MTRRDMPARDGRAADALIATYVRELLAEDDVDPVCVAHMAAVRAPMLAAVEAAPTSVLPTDATR